ncbi:exopolyphosphatase [Amylibacter marinus]|uniref:Exopolyphosphatase n=1 Tax=Amylibacter marinus TaxID=1475483 RepID=A0ABQ5VV49_9RHOB|nr:Ppx/GppA family phosphatase [Amylibacter marinus]GLQ34963.1 exopolyphosphatase [Amylibacter marinus]
MTDSAAQLDRMGVIDVGSNSVRFVVFDGANRAPAYFYNEKVMCGLGLELAQTGILHPEGRARALLALKRFVAIAKPMNLTHMRAVATEAVRRATDGADFCAEVLRETGIVLEVISGEEEAELSAQGIFLSTPNATGMVCDIGGSSMELASFQQGEITRSRSSRLGPLAVLGLHLDSDQQARHIATQLDTLVAGFDTTPQLLYLVGGSWRAMANIHMRRNAYPLRVLQDYQVTPADLLPTLVHIIGLDLEALRAYGVASDRRLSLLPMAAQTLIALLEKIQPAQLSISSYGLREGILYNSMSQNIRALDPLIEAARATERAQARFHGFGDRLFTWLRPLFQDHGQERLRLIHAACLMHDVNWRSHPDYRANISFDAATLANLGGIDHAGRVFLAWALMKRYKVRDSASLDRALLNLISAEDLKIAQMVGRAMRLGAMMSGADAYHMGAFHVTDDTITLCLPPDSRPIIGEVVQKRLNGLAKTLRKEANISYTSSVAPPSSID